MFTTFFVIIAKPEDQLNTAEWRTRMRTMLNEVLVLFPMAFDDSKFKDPKKSEKIQKSMQSLIDQSSGLKVHASRVSSEKALRIDPSFSFIAQAFESELTSAKLSYLHGGSSLVESQKYLRSAISKCMLCHSQSQIGPALKFGEFKKQLSALAPTDRFTALAATRQFDDALNEFDKYIKSLNVKPHDSFSVESESKEALAIAIRVKNDPKRTLSIIDEITESGAASAILAIELKDWRKSTLEWMSEKTKVLDTDQKLYSEAKRLVEKTKDVDNERNSDVDLLRATSDLHLLLSTFQKSPLRAQSYLLLASTYDLLPGFAIWDLPEEYLGACIEENPHSEIGEKCFADYEKDTVLGYSGSAGTNIPAAISKHLEHLRNIAKRPTH